MSIKKTLREFYPRAFKELSSGKIQEPPLTQETVFLSAANWQKIQKIVKSFYQLKEDPLYQKRIFKKRPEIAQSRQNSPLMAYDFHLQEELKKERGGSGAASENSSANQDSSPKIQEGSLKLIEINTNASAFLFANLLYQAGGEDFKSPLKALKKAFLKEWSLFNPHKKTPKIILIDEAVESQKMRLEFFMYQDFFKSMSWDLEILDSKSLSLDEEAFLYTPRREKIDFIYNRCTDFYFDNHPALKKAYQKKTCLILPQPRDYALLSDKARLFEWQELPQLKAIQKHLLKARPFNEQTEEEIWKKRKKYFFKIQQGYGGKLAYRGSSLSHKKKELLLKRESLAQELSPPSLLIDSQGEKWKLDLRAYSYKDQVQQLIARVYQGQATNFKVKGSGFAKVKII